VEDLKIVVVHVRSVDLVSVWTKGSVVVIATRNNPQICGATMIIAPIVTHSRIVASQTVVGRAKLQPSVRIIVHCAMVSGVPAHVTLHVRPTQIVTVSQGARNVLVELARDPRAVLRPVSRTLNAAPTRTAAPNASAISASAAGATPSATTPQTATIKATVHSAWVVSPTTVCARPCAGVRAWIMRSATEL